MNSEFVTYILTSLVLSIMAAWCLFMARDRRERIGAFIFFFIIWVLFTVSVGKDMCRQIQKETPSVKPIR